MRSLVKKSVLIVEQEVDNGEVGATLAELVNGGLNESDLLYICFGHDRNFHFYLTAFLPILSIFVFLPFPFMRLVRQELTFKRTLWSIIK